MKHAMEPIIPLGTPGPLGSTEWRELLYRGVKINSTGRLYPTLPEWRDWYEHLPSILDAAFRRQDDVRISVNVSTDQLLDPRIRQRLMAVAKWGRRLAVEWVEDPFREPRSGKRTAAAFLNVMRSQFAVLIGIDDVGAGKDGMGRMLLLDEPPDFVKLDGGLLRGVQSRRALEALLAEQISGFRKLGIEVVGEQIETLSLLHLAERLNLGFVQGFLFAHPVGSAASSGNSDEQARAVQQAALRSLN